MTIAFSYLINHSRLISGRSLFNQQPIGNSYPAMAGDVGSLHGKGDAIEGY